MKAKVYKKGQLFDGFIKLDNGHKLMFPVRPKKLKRIMIKKLDVGMDLNINFSKYNIQIDVIGDLHFGNVA